MPWIPPAPPLNQRQSKITYWRLVLKVPADEPAAPMLRSMAARRLLELGALSETEIAELYSILRMEEQEGLGDR